MFTQHDNSSILIPVVLIGDYTEWCYSVVMLSVATPLRCTPSHFPEQGSAKNKTPRRNFLNVLAVSAISRI
jgi:hypothetical protein